MIIKYILLLTLSTFLLAQEVVHSSVSTYFESKTIDNSKQKEDGVVYGIGADIHFSGSEIKLAYEQGDTKTIRPQVPKDLEFKKMFFKYAYRFDKNFELNVNYIGIQDNLVDTDGGIVGGGGMTYNFNRKASFNFTQYFTDYDDFDTFQSDLRIDYKTKIGKVKVKFSSITKYIYIEDTNSTNNLTKNAQKDYTTTGIKIHSHYNSYHLGLGAFFGKRAFAIMDDGFKIQHHAMEFDRTYAIGLGKSISDFVLRFQYIYQRAEELPYQNKNVEIQNLRFMANYKF